jgi:hypothetical protein
MIALTQVELAMVLAGGICIGIVGGLLGAIPLFHVRILRPGRAP